MSGPINSATGAEPGTRASRAQFPPIGLGLSSVILGAIGLGAFILPVVSLPIGLAGMALGGAGMVASYFGSSTSRRLSVAGVLLSAAAVVMVGAIARAPSGYFTTRGVFPSLSPGSERPYVPPPAEPRWSAPPERGSTAPQPD